MNNYLYNFFEYNDIILYGIVAIIQIILLSVILKILIPLIKKKLKFKVTFNNINKYTKIKYYQNNINNIFDELDYEYRLFNYNIFSFLTYLVICFILFIVAYLLSFNFLKLHTTSFLIACMFSIVPYIILKILIKNRKNKILELFPSYLVNLKTYTRVDNNIINAISKVSVSKPLKRYIEIFNISNKNGVSIFKSFEILKKNINIDKISNFLTLLQHCSISGGDVTKILDKYAKMQMRINLRDEKEKQSIFTSKLSLVILVIINIYILFGFILSNTDNYILITTTLVGQIILNINIISLSIIGYLYYKISEV